VDDVELLDEPYFQDGSVATTVRTTVLAGVSYATAAGNDALSHLEQPFCPGPGGLHDFVCGSGQTGLGIVVASGTTLNCFLQWNDPVGGSANDYELLAVDAASQQLLALSNNLQTGTQDPFEFISWTNPRAQPRDILIGIRLVQGQSRLLDLFCFDEDSPIQFPIDQPGGSIFGHAAVAEVLTVAAIDAKSPGLTTVESFSSEGPVQIFFPSPETRHKPDLAGFDDVSTTLPSPFSPFFGTSAAAPHVAAVAALLLHKNPFLTPAEIQSAIASTAAPIGTPTVDVAGTGRLDALAATNAVPVPHCLTDSACNDGNVCVVARACQAGACTAGAPLNCDDGIACTADACLPSTGCVHTIAAGPGGVLCVWAVARHSDACAGASVPPSADRHVMHAAGLIQSALTATRPPRVHRLLGHAQRTLRSVRPILMRAKHQRKISSQCGKGLIGALHDSLGRLR
jgi:hypothetical protein